MKSKPNLDEFINGGAASEATLVTKKWVKSHQKVFLLPPDIIDQLRLEAARLSVANGYRVSESSIVTDALREYLHS